MSISQVAANEIYKHISNHEETEGFDLCAGANWIYPLNFPIRDYQFNIVKNALFENTLVSLPTGLGKTFIAAVLMYNYFRWYPNGKIIFMAPTKPLVRQQIDACYNIVGIPKESTVELTGTIQQTTRANLWREKRVFFITPHVLQNDLDSTPEIADNIKCLVLDEAHKAKGTYAYCQVMRKLQERNKHFRVLALSATPGGTVREILEVAKTLYISHLEVKTDESVDVAPYVYKRSLVTINVPFDKKLYDVREEYLKIIEQYARVLMQNKVFTGNYSQFTKGRIFLTIKDYQAKKAKNVNIPNYNHIMKSLNICLTLYHGLELLTRHGLRGFLLYYEEHIQKPLLRGNQALHDIINDLKEYLGPLPDWRPLSDGSIPKLAKNVRFGHPKFRKLGDVLSAHFIQSDDDATRVIVFFEYKDSVIEAHALLLEYHPLIRAKVFMGQSSITQKLQKSTLNIFRSGECNTLLSTSIGEEGLDVGEVDLIVCFDISSKSPIRMVQRMGRTGRKREGKVIVLITEGKEEELLRECLIQKKTLNESILNCSELHTHLYQENPKMVPDDVQPECKKIHIRVRKEEEKQPGPSKVTKTSTKRIRNNSNSNPIKTMFESISLSEPGTSNAEVTYPETVDKLRQPILHCLGDPDIAALENKQFVDFSKYLEKQRSWQNTFLVDHSKNSELLRSILQFADSKRFNIPQTQIERTKSVKTGAGLYQSDIRSMFLKQKNTSIPISQLEVDLNLNEKVAEILIENKQYECSSNLQTEIRDYLTITYSNMFSCEMCDKYKDMCNVFKNSVRDDHNLNVLSWTQPDSSIFDYLNKDTLNKFLRQANEENDNEEIIIDEGDEFISTSLFDDIMFQDKEPIKEDTFHLESRTSSTNEIGKINNLVDSFKDDDFFTMDFISDLLVETQNKDVNKISSMKKTDEEKNCGETSEKNNKSDDSKSISNEGHENTVLFDDDFISSDILSQINKNSSIVKDDGSANIVKKSVASQRSVDSTQEKSKSPRKSFKFKCESAINKTLDDILKNSDFFSEDILNELLNINFIHNSRKPPNLRQNSSPNKSFKRISEIDESVVLADIISHKEFTNNKATKTPQKDGLEKDKKINFKITSNDDDFMDFTAIFAEIVKEPPIKEDHADSNDTILNLTASDCDEVNSLNEAFFDPTSKSNSKSIEETNNSPNKLPIQVPINYCLSPDLFSDSDPCTPELDKDLLDKSQDRTILFSPKSSRNLKHSPRTPPSSNSKNKSSNMLLSSDSELVEKSPSLWNLSKLYTQTSRDFNGTSAKRNLSSSMDCIESLNFSDSMFNDCDDEDLNAVSERVEKKPKAKRKVSLALNSLFIDKEVLVDGSQSTDEDEVDLNEYDASFVNDASQDVGNTTALHAFYLKTTRSPKKKHKGFKIPALPKMDKMDIFSQIEPTQNDTYLEDSFCVDVLTQNITEEKEIDVLEEAERILKNRKRRKKSSNSEDDNKKKRRRILLLSDSD